MRKTLFKPLAYSLPLLALAGLWCQSMAAQPDDIIKYRREVMKSQGAHMSAVTEIIKGKVDFKSDLLYHAMALDASTQTIPNLFPPGSDFGDTRAKPEVWKKRPEFEKVAKEAGKAGADFLAAVKTNNNAAIREKFTALGEACKTCHKDFREKQK